MTISGSINLIAAQEVLPPVGKIDVGSAICAVAFTANGEYLISGGDGAQVWRLKDGQQMTNTNTAMDCLAVSKDGRWIAVETDWDGAIVWDAETYKQVFAHKGNSHTTYGVDFSPDSTRLIVASRQSYNTSIVTVWDLALGKRVQTLCHEGLLRAAKYSPLGDRIATATRYSVRVWDSNNGRLLLDIPVTPTAFGNAGVIWFNNHLLVVSRNKIKQIDASTGSTVSEWAVPDGDCASCIALSRYGEFIAYSATRTVTFWDTSTHTQLGLIQHPQDIRSIALSPDDRFLAIGGEDNKIVIESLSFISVSTMCSLIGPYLNNNFCVPFSLRIGFDYFP